MLVLVQKDEALRYAPSIQAALTELVRTGGQIGTTAASLAQNKGDSTAAARQAAAWIAPGLGGNFWKAVRVEATRFFGAGMLLNVIAAMGLLDAEEPWALRLLEGFKS